MRGIVWSTANSEFPASASTYFCLSEQTDEFLASRSRICKESEVVMSYLTRITTVALCFSVTLLAGAFASAQTTTSQVPVSPVRVAPLPTLIVPGQNRTAVHAISTEGSGD